MLPKMFYRSWILANAAGEALGLGTTFALGVWLAPKLGSVQAVDAVLTAGVAAVLLGTLLEGIVVGACQARVLRDAWPALGPRAWIIATALGAGAAWLLGMIPSTVMSLADVQPGSGAAASGASEPAAIVKWLMAALLGFLLGPVLAVAQLFVLRRHVTRAGRWIAANALAWTIGMPAIFVGMELLPWETGGWTLIAGLYIVSGVAGAIVGAIHGRALLQMLPRAPHPVAA